MEEQEHLQILKQRCFEYRDQIWKEIREIEPEKWWKLMPYYHKQIEDVYSQIRDIEYAEMLLCEEQ